jgi:hypothetical protein
VFVPAGISSARCLTQAGGLQGAVMIDPQRSTRPQLEQGFGSCVCSNGSGPPDGGPSSAPAGAADDYAPPPNGRPQPQQLRSKRLQTARS